MIHRITTKLEIDVMQETELAEAMELAHTHRMPAIVVHPELTTAANIQRVRSQAGCKIIVPVDWPKGEKSGMTKLQGMTTAALSQDGFEILISHHDNPGLVKTELKTLTEFVKNQLPPTVEVRFVIGSLSRGEGFTKMVCSILKDIPAPTLVRTDNNLRIQQSKANVQTHNRLVELIKLHTGRPIKLSGNINSLKTVAACKADRYGVSLKQANSLIRELIQNPEKSRKLLDPDPVAADAI